MDLTVAVIAKECVPGRVKTRLSPPLPPEGAAQLAQLSLSRTLDTVRNLPAKRRLLVMDGTPTKRDDTDFTVLPQASGGLDERLAAICDAVSGPLLIIGMDTPQFCRRHVEPMLHDWSTAHPRHDGWIGPATDGGFWALALRRPDGNLIRGVPMSTASTGERQLTRLTASGISVGMLPELRDMDYFSDALQIATEMPGSEFAEAVAGAVAQTAVLVQSPRQEVGALL